MLRLRVSNFFFGIIFKVWNFFENLPRFLSIFLILFFLLALFSCVSTEQYSLDQPNISGDIRVWDFGQVKEGDVLEHSFLLRNFQDKPLFISNIHTSCGCTVSETPKKYLLPGEQAPIKVKFHTQGYSGLVQQQVYVHTDCVSTPIIKFSVKAEVLK